MNTIKNATPLHRTIRKAAIQARLDYEELRAAFFTLRNGSARRNARDILSEAVFLLMSTPQR